MFAFHVPSFWTLAASICVTRLHLCGNLARRTPQFKAQRQRPQLATVIDNIATEIWIVTVRRGTLVSSLRRQTNSEGCGSPQFFMIQIKEDRWRKATGLNV